MDGTTMSRDRFTHARSEIDHAILEGESRELHSEFPATVGSRAFTNLDAFGENTSPRAHSPKENLV
jgi:hypothetical protein